MILGDVLSGDLTVLDKIEIDYKKILEYNEQYSKNFLYSYPFFKELKEYLKNAYFLLNNKISIAEHKDIKTKNYYFTLLGYKENGYLIYEIEYNLKKTTFLINFDLSETFFYILDDKQKPINRFYIDDNYNVFTSFLEYKDFYAFVDYTSFKHYNEKQTLLEIIIELKENCPFKYISQLEFLNKELKSIKTTPSYHKLFINNPIKKIVFFRKKKTDMNYIHFLTDSRYNSYDLDNVDGEYLEQLKTSFNLGINLCNPFIANEFDQELFVLNFSY